MRDTSGCVLPPTTDPYEVARVRPGVSCLESTRRAYEDYVRDRAPQRHYL